MAGAVVLMAAAISLRGGGPAASLMHVAFMLLLSCTGLLLFKCVYDVFLYLCDLRIGRRSGAVKAAKDELDGAADAPTLIRRRATVATAAR
eukprot:gene185-33389_t